MGGAHLSSGKSCTEYMTVGTIGGRIEQFTVHYVLCRFIDKLYKSFSHLKEVC